MIWYSIILNNRNQFPRDNGYINSYSIFCWLTMVCLFPVAICLRCGKMFITSHASCTKTLTNNEQDPSKQQSCFNKFCWRKNKYLSFIPSLSLRCFLSQNIILIPVSTLSILTSYRNATFMPTHQNKGIENFFNDLNWHSLIWNT